VGIYTPVAQTITCYRVGKVRNNIEHACAAAWLNYCCLACCMCSCWQLLCLLLLKGLFPEDLKTRETGDSQLH
jgi:hypothetical protein